VAGEFDGRSYALGDLLGPGDTPDRVTAMAANIGGVVLGYNYDDASGSEQLTVAQNSQLLRYTLETGWGDHREGDPLNGAESGIGGILQALGFNPDAWLEHGTVLRLTWKTLDALQDPEAHRRLYFGPLRMRADYVHQAARDG